MGVQRRLTALLAALALASSWSGLARASGPSESAPWYLDEYGGDPADLKTFYEGRTGIVMPTAPRPMLFISWRLLHGQKVGAVAGEGLSRPCCGGSWWASRSPGTGQGAWLAARVMVPGAVKLDYIRTERDGPNYASMPNCFDEAFDTATAVLKERIAQHGAGSREVGAWLATQDAVFKSCREAGVIMPSPLAGAPAWLMADRAYQEAAQALYDGRNEEAAVRFAEIARDRGSPWRSSGLYLTARARVRGALAQPGLDAFAKAQVALTALSAAPAGTFGQGEVKPLRSVLAFHERPKEFLAQVGRELAQPQPTADFAVMFRDYSELADAEATKPELIDWIATMRARPVAGSGESTSEQEAAEAAAARRAALDHARARWQAGRDVAWLIAALSLTDPGDPGAAELAKAGDAVAPASPGWLTVQYHLIRLTLSSRPAAASRARLDAILARRDLSLSDRNIFTAQRAQAAASREDFMRYALRKRLCPDDLRSWDNAKAQEPSCVRQFWNDSIQPSGIYDGVGGKGTTGFGEDARAAIDRAPLATRIAISQDKGLRPALRLDVALTSYGRAVQLQDNAAIDTLSRDLATLLPLMAADFRGVVAAKPGPDKRFAEFLVLAKIPGLRDDLVDLTRPEGARVVDFQSYWTDWVIMSARAPPPRAPRPLANYQNDGFGVQAWYGDGRGTPDPRTDLTCLGECGVGASPVRLPDFIAAGQARAAVERRYFTTFDQRYDGKPQPYPPGGVAAWDEMIDYAKAHRGDPRVPEALHWLVHVGHFGGSHKHSGQRAFKLLHARYAGSAWAKTTPYYYD
ncbi:hypothetical protein [Phenylobacterium sp.]|uniref:hypothetical protein n=1 Tax=Phenylobacterium sp. TaxID=1871053 RepID=UPI0035657E3D